MKVPLLNSSEFLQSGGSYLAEWCSEPASGEEDREVAYFPSQKVQVPEDGEEGSVECPKDLEETKTATEDFEKLPLFSWRKLWMFTGPGVLMSIAYLDPGNLEGDLQAGAVDCYELLWLLAWATGMGLHGRQIVFPSSQAPAAVDHSIIPGLLSVPGTVDDSAVPLLLSVPAAVDHSAVPVQLSVPVAVDHSTLPVLLSVPVAVDHSTIPVLLSVIQLVAARVGVATGQHLAEICRQEYAPVARLGLWLLMEIAIVGADIQEVIGTAIAIRILSNGAVPLYAGVLITALDSALFLFLGDLSVRKLEAFFGFLITLMSLCFIRMFVLAGPDPAAIVHGLFVPYVGPSSAQQAVGLLGAVFMPHNIFLHSALVQSRNIGTTSEVRMRDALRYYNIESALALFVTFVINAAVITVFAVAFCRRLPAGGIGLSNAADYLRDHFGTVGGLVPMHVVWALGLLAAGQSSTMTGTYAGQFVMGGFLDWHIKPWKRVLITRSFAIVPTVVVAVAFGNGSRLDVLNEWLNILQSLHLPFALVPLLTLASKTTVMGRFTIGWPLKVACWVIASLVLTINAYLLVVFSLYNLPRSMLIHAALFTLALLYLSFVLYLAFAPATPLAEGPRRPVRGAGQGAVSGL